MSRPVPPPVPPITWPKEYTFIGKKDIIRNLAPKMVRGKWDFASDIVLPDMLYARALGSAYAHAKITSIDTSKAEALPGVKAVVTNKDQPELFPVEVTSWGQQVAAVAATDVHIAEEALSLIDVKYEPLPFTLDPMEAYAEKVDTGCGVPKNKIGPLEIKRGDWAKGFADADVIIEDEVGYDDEGNWSEYFGVNTMEPRACVAKWDGDEVTLWISSQNPFANRAAVAGYLKWPENKVRVISHGSGCGFGDKHRYWQPGAAALLAKKAGAPVKLVCDEYERTTQSGHNAALWAKIKIGAKKDGTFTAMEETMYFDNPGTQSVEGLPGQQTSSPMATLRLTYTCPNAHFVGWTITTNKPWRTAMRSGGHEAQGSFVKDVVIDELADKLGMDPLDLRLKNAFKGKEDQDTPGLLYSKIDLVQCMTKAADAIGWKTKWHKPGTKTLPDGRLHGIGFSEVISVHGGLSSAGGAIILMTPDGKAEVQVGTSHSHGGSSTVMAIIAAEALGLASMDDVTVLSPGDTATNPNSGGEGGSTRVASVGAGIYMAAQDIKAQFFEIAAPLLGVKPEELESKGGKVYVKADPTKFLTHKDICSKAPAATGSDIVGRGTMWFAPTYTKRTPCVEAAEVAVDPETGKVEILSFAVVDDTGQPIHWKGTENQQEGGAYFMIAEALIDSDQILDKATGATLNFSQLDQKYWATSDALPPEKLASILVVSIDEVGPYGARGIGEPPCAVGIGAIINAIYNATGKWLKRQPATERAVLKALGKA